MGRIAESMDWAICVPIRHANTFDYLFKNALGLHRLLQNYIDLMDTLKDGLVSYWDDLEDKVDFWKAYDFPHVLDTTALEKLAENLEHYREIYSKLRFHMDAVEDCERNLKDNIGLLHAQLDVAPDND